MDDFTQADDVVDLRTYAIILWRRRWTVVLTTVIVVLTAVGLTFAQTPLFEATSELAIEPLRRSEETNLTDLFLGSAIIETERRVITSGPVTEAVIDTLQLDTTDRALLDQVTVTVVRDTRVVTITAIDPSPELAAAIANTFASEYLTLRRQEALDRLLAARDSLEQRSKLLQQELARVNAELARTADEQDVKTLEAERDSLLTQLGQVSAQELSADAETDLVRGGGTILRNAEVAAAPSSPKKARTGVLALVLGGMLGVGLAFAREFLDDGVHSEDVLVRASGGAPVFGRIPTWEEEHRRAVAVVAPTDHAVEAYRELRANVRFVIGQKSRDSEWEGRRRSTRLATEVKAGKSVLITSSIAGEGKSSTAANLAVVAAQGGARIVLIDADMRRPTAGTLFGIGQSGGLSHHLAEGGDLKRRLIPTGLPGLTLLPAGPTPPNPAELLSSRAMLDVITELEAMFDLVVIDSPPILAVADALELSQIVSATLLVSSYRTSSQRAVKRAVERLGHIGVLVSGTVLNNIDRSADKSYYGYYEPYAAAVGNVLDPPKVPATPPATPAAEAPAKPATVAPPVAAPAPVAPAPASVVPDLQPTSVAASVPTEASAAPRVEVQGKFPETAPSARNDAERDANNGPLWPNVTNS